MNVVARVHWMPHNTMDMLCSEMCTAGHKVAAHSVLDFFACHSIKADENKCTHRYELLTLSLWLLPGL